jgi:hypothetical protein
LLEFTLSRVRRAMPVVRRHAEAVNLNNPRRRGERERPAAGAGTRLQAQALVLAETQRAVGRDDDMIQHLDVE